MTDKLEPCPFCGGEAEWSVEGEPGHENSWISCRDCGSSANDMETWNRRAPAPTADGGVREAADALDKMLGCYADSMPEEAYHATDRVLRLLRASLTRPTDAEAVRDKARLDWLGRPQPSGTAFRFLMCNRGCWAVVDPEVDIPVEDWEPGPRSAIDAAMKKAALATPAPKPGEGWDLERHREAIRQALKELGVPSEATPAPVAEAVRILTLALCNGICPPCDIGENTECLCGGYDVGIGKVVHEEGCNEKD